MRRGEIYRVEKPSARDPRKFRLFVIVSRQVLVDSRFSTAVCAPVYSSYEGLSTQVPLGAGEGLKRDCAIHCDELVSLPKAILTNYVAMLAPDKLRLLDRSLRSALQIYDS